MPDKKIHDALNEHITLELHAWYAYTGMSLWFEIHDLPGMASFMKQQADEEMAHANRIIQHLLDRDVHPVLPTIKPASVEYESVKSIFESMLAAEQKVTASIENCYRIAEQEDDQPARLMLEWFIGEQVEEEALARSIIGRINLAGDTGPGLLLVDQELGKREPHAHENEA
ncbi:MAG: ferritin [Planctomycetota bacterium]